ncbi:elongator complex protein [Histoplasma capsulatum var. duboisii H88]|uniref:Elongator complex protein 1 n=1 Tax=Ajellomyces capsulatus (strain H88) TaxID=544711 RepID=F0U5C3_AJEC8|nr:elongator complex protein [Histoplasma capsulatum var. duboisii H88]QSS51461.1 elongator complex protein [Histoplasma capsulatum var. duboisii H88]
MRNLRNIHLNEVPLGSGLPLTATAWDSATDSIICAFGPSETTAIIELKRKSQGSVLSDLDLIASWDAPSPIPDLQQDRIVSLQHFADTLITCLVLEGGDIIVVREDPQPGEDKIEIVGSVDVGITAATWSLDEELLTITTKSDTLLYMTRDFENVANIAFTSDDLKISRHVSVGWGKKETQFQGKRAKALRDPTMPEKVDEGRLSDMDDKRVSISWRGDGAFVAVSSIQSDARRVIRVYSRDGVLDSVSEPVDGLEGALSWRPAGNLIAGIQRMEDRVDVVFFERNGLRHGEFKLRLTQEDMRTWASTISLAWNVDSTVLAVQFKDRVQLWTMGNYHYYLKQEIPISVEMGSGSGLLCFRWHQEKALRFVIGSSDKLFDIEYVFDVARGSTIVPNDLGAAAVIDGRSLKLTPLKLSNVPPPMAACDIPLESNAVDIAFSKSSAQFAVLTMGGIYLYNWDIKAVPLADPEFQAFCPILTSSSRPRRIAFLEENEVYVLTQHGCSQGNIERTDIDSKKTTTIYQSNNSSILSSIFPNVQQNSLWICQRGQNSKAGSYIKLSSGGANGPLTEIPHESPGQDTCWANATELPDGEGILFSLSKSGALYANKRLIAKSCTSFIITGAHLIFTTTQHLLKFVHITKVDDLDIPGDTPETDERCRSIERGARIISVMPSIFAVTLQMPRGNTETIYPRALVLAGIRKYVDNKKYRAAYLACRSHMVDMNILHDHFPSQFMANVSLFIDQVKKVEYIDEFLSRLRNEDVSETLYKNTLKIAVPDVAVSDAPKSVAPGDANKTAPKDNKVNRICDAFLSVLASRIDTNLRNLVTAHVCKSPPDLDSGLQLVAKLREKSTEQAEEAVEHMCFLTDAYRLYDHALGLYDLQLTLMVAQQAQKDPREYLPFLQKLQAMPTLRCQYEIDNHLGRVRKALRSLHTLQAYEELKLYAIKHTLYSDALELYKYQPELLRDMSHLYADYLYDQSNYKEAAIIYESLSLYEPAYQSYKLAHQWRECIYCASLVPLSKDQMNSLTRSLATTLTDETKDYISAAHIHAQHLQDIPTAARLLCCGNQFGDACRLLVLHGKQSLVSDIVDSALGDAMGSTIDLLADCKAQLNTQVPRIRELRVRRANDPLGFYGGDPTTGMAEGDADIPDNVSLAPTDASTMAGQSMFTRYTGNTSSSRKTSKTRRREERKRARGKKGTVYEEEYLVNSVRRLIERVNGAIDEGETLIQALLRRGMRERAALVQHHLDEVLGMCRDCLDDVFEVIKEKAVGVSGTDVEGSIGDDGGLGGERPPGGEGVFWDSLQQSLRGKGREPPVIKEFRKLVILGG